MLVGRSGDPHFAGDVDAVAAAAASATARSLKRAAAFNFAELQNGLSRRFFAERGGPGVAPLAGAAVALIFGMFSLSSVGSTSPPASGPASSGCIGANAEVVGDNHTALRGGHALTADADARRLRDDAGTLFLALARIWATLSFAVRFAALTGGHALITDAVAGGHAPTVEALLLPPFASANAEKGPRMVLPSTLSVAAVGFVYVFICDPFAREAITFATPAGPGVSLLLLWLNVFKLRLVEGSVAHFIREFRKLSTSVSLNLAMRSARLISHPANAAPRSPNADELPPLLRLLLFLFLLDDLLFFLPPLRADVSTLRSVEAEPFGFPSLADPDPDRLPDELFHDSVGDGILSSHSSDVLF